MDDEPPVPWTMREALGGPGWWLGPDGRWYPPEQRSAQQGDVVTMRASLGGPGWWLAPDGRWHAPDDEPDRPDHGRHAAAGSEPGDAAAGSEPGDAAAGSEPGDAAAGSEPGDAAAGSEPGDASAGGQRAGGPSGAAVPDVGNAAAPRPSRGLGRLLPWRRASQRAARRGDRQVHGSKGAGGSHGGAAAACRS